MITEAPVTSCSAIESHALNLISNCNLDALLVSRFGTNDWSMSHRFFYIKVMSETRSALLHATVMICFQLIMATLWPPAEAPTTSCSAIESHVLSFESMQPRAVLLVSRFGTNDWSQWATGFFTLRLCQKQDQHCMPRWWFAFNWQWQLRPPRISLVTSTNAVGRIYLRHRSLPVLQLRGMSCTSSIFNLAALLVFSTSVSIRNKRLTGNCICDIHPNMILLIPFFVIPWYSVQWRCECPFSCLNVFENDDHLVLDLPASWAVYSLDATDEAYRHSRNTLVISPGRTQTWIEDTERYSLASDNLYSDRYYVQTYRILFITRDLWKYPISLGMFHKIVAASIQFSESHAALHRGADLPKA